MGQVVSGKRVNPPSKNVDLFAPRGYSWELVLRVCRSVVQILTLLVPKKCHFSHPFSDLTFKKLRHQGQQPKKFLKINFEFAYFSFFLTLLELKRCVQTRP